MQTINQYMVLGDPTQEAFSDVPKGLNVITSLTGSNYKVNVRANGVFSAGALVAVNQNSESKASGYTDSLGNYNFNSALIQNQVL